MTSCPASPFTALDFGRLDSMGTASGSFDLGASDDPSEREAHHSIRYPKKLSNLGAPLYHARVDFETHYGSAERTVIFSLYSYICIKYIKL